MADQQTFDATPVGVWVIVAIAMLVAIHTLFAMWRKRA